MKEDGGYFRRWNTENLRRQPGALVEAVRSIGSDTKVRVVVAITAVHVAVLLFSYRPLTVGKGVFAAGLFSVSFPAAFLLISLLVALLVIFVVGSMLVVAFQADGFAGVLKALLIVWAVMLALGAVVLLAPPLAAFVLVGEAADSTLLAIVAGVVVGGVWFVLLKYGPPVIQAVLAGQLAHAITLHVLGVATIRDYVELVAAQPRSLLRRSALEEILETIGGFVRLIDMPFPLMVWCALLGAMFAHWSYAREKSSSGSPAEEAT